MILSLVAALDRNGVIGDGNDLPWHVPADLRRFRELTVGHDVIMGRKTFESIYARLGKPLPKRRSIVLSRTARESADDVIWVPDLDSAMHVCMGDEAFVIGGAEVFKMALPLVQKMYLTEIDAEVPGDVFFPQYDPAEWKETFRSDANDDSDASFKYSFVTYERI